MTSALWQTPLPGVLLTISAFLAARAAQRRAQGHPLLNPVAGAIALIALALTLGGLRYETYFESAKFLHWLLGPATVALAVPLARELPRVRALALPLSVAIGCGCSTAAISAVLLAKVCGASSEVVLSLAPKSVTTPIAIAISEQIGGAPSLTAVLVILTGLVGAVCGRPVLDRLGVHDPAARGVATGVAAHGLGTAAIYRESPEAGAFSGLAIGLSGLFTAIAVPVLVRWFGLH
jgi:predicted murein hydrolase (TIGR00659 family)